MGLVFNKSGKVTERTRWNLSFSGLSLSHKRGRLTLNTRGRSNFRVAKGLNFRVHTGLAYFLWVLFFAIDGLLWLLGGTAFLFVALFEGVYYGAGWLFSMWTEKKETDPIEQRSLLEATQEKATSFEPFSVESLSLDSPAGIYDMKTVNGKIYEVEIVEGERGQVSLDDEFGRISADSKSPTFDLVRLQVTKDSKGKFTVRKPNGVVSTMTTRAVIEIVCVRLA